jgi:osmotically-inducible protein OsmY
MANPGNCCEAEGNCRGTLTGRDYLIAALSLVSGAALGAAVMYLWDPNRGKARRARLQERAVSTARRAGEQLAGRGEDLFNRARGVAARAGSAVWRYGEVDDEVVEARVRSHLGHLTPHAHAISTDVKDGIVTLEGTLPDEEKYRVLEQVRGLAGVKDVVDRFACAMPA